MELRVDVNSLLRRAKVPKANLTKQERIGLSQLKKDKDSHFNSRQGGGHGHYG